MIQVGVVVVVAVAEIAAIVGLGLLYRTVRTRRVTDDQERVIVIRRYPAGDGTRTILASTRLDEHRLDEIRRSIAAGVLVGDDWTVEP